MEELHNRIKLVFKNSGMTQIEISKVLKIAQSSISNMMAGKIKPSKRTLDDIAEHFDVNLEWLKNGKGPMKPAHPLKEELSNFFAKTIATDVPYRDEFILALSKLEPEHWQIIGEIIMRTAENVKRRKAEEEEGGEQT